MAHDVAVLVGIEVADGEILHGVEHGAAGLMQKALRHVCHKLSVKGDGDKGQGIKTDEDTDL